MKVSKFVCLTMGMLCLSGRTYADSTMSVADSLFAQAQANNRVALIRAVRNGYPIDSVDENGNTALCKAMLAKDNKAYSLLRQMGANTNHACVKRLEAALRSTKSEAFAWNIGPTTYLGAAALIGGTVAIAASGSGGSDNDKDNTNSDGTSEGGENPDEGGSEGGGELTELTPADFETDEYKKGNFLAQIGASQAYARFYSVDADGNLSSDLELVRVGVVDTGVYGAHQEFVGKNIQGVNYDYGPCSKSGNSTNCWAWNGKDAVTLTLSTGETYKVMMEPEDYVAWEAEYADGYDWNEVKDSPTSFYPNEGQEGWHGTHVAGIIAANLDDTAMHGVAFDNAELLAARWDMMSPIEAPVNDLVDMGAQVINFSLGIDSTELINAANVAYFEEQLDQEGYLEAFRTQAENSVVFVFSAGNEAQTQPGILNGIPLLDEFKDSLKDLFVTVVAVDENNNISDYSNRCGAAQNYCIAAPGDNIFSTVTGESSYTNMDGTSMAAPVVTGSIAFLMGAYPYMTPQEVVSLVFETATDLGDAGVDAIYGHGLINLDEATKPQGELEIASGSNVNGESISFRSTSMSVPAVYQSALLAKMPKAVTVLDKYKRPYAMPMASIVRATHSGDRNFKNDLYAFSRYQPKRKIKANDNLTFSYAPAALKTSPTGLGTMEVEFADGNNVTGFYYTENTAYNNDSYFEKTLSNPFLAMNSAYGFYNRYSPASDWNVSMGFSVGENGLYDGSLDENDRDFDNQAYGFDSEISYQLSEKVNLGFISGILYEDSAMLGLNGSGGFDVGDSSTYFAGVSVSWQPVKNLYLSGAYYQGWTDAGNMASNLMQTSRLVSDSFALDGHYQYNATDVIGLQISSPLRIYRGKAKFDLPVGRDDYSDEVYRQQYSASLKPDAREYKFSLYHDRELNEDMNFKTQFDMRLNPDHQKGAETDYRVMFGFNWTFN